MNFMDLRALKDFYSTQPTFFDEPIKCHNCKRLIFLSEQEIKARCLYLSSDWHKCLCPNCTQQWKKENKISEVEK